jgi:hypothetical protein
MIANQTNRADTSEYVLLGVKIGVFLTVAPIVIQIFQELGKSFENPSRPISYRICALYVNECESLSVPLVLNGFFSEIMGEAMPRISICTTVAILYDAGANRWHSIQQSIRDLINDRQRYPDLNVKPSTQLNPCNFSQKTHHLKSSE